MHISFKEHPDSCALPLPASKSISNRLLVLKKLYFPNLRIENLSKANDTVLMLKLLDSIDNTEILSVEDAGTVARFGSAVCAVFEKEHTITGTERMHLRPMDELILALRQLGNSVICLEQEGHLPIKIKKGVKTLKTIKIRSENSSQFISALLMISPTYNDGLILEIEGRKPSFSYAMMTFHLMKSLGMTLHFDGSKFNISPHEITKNNVTYEVENDWSSVAFFIEWLSFMPVGTSISFKNLYPPETSLQGDSLLANWSDLLGCSVTFKSGEVLFSKKGLVLQDLIELDFTEIPDLALPIITALACHRRFFKVKGIETLAHKESDRMHALAVELRKCRIMFKPTSQGFEIDGRSFNLQPNTEFHCWNDHRIAMCLSILAIFNPCIIDQPETVTKSFPGFWDALSQLGFQLNTN